MSQTTQSTMRGWWLWLIAALFYALDYFQHTAPSVLIKPIAQTSGISLYYIGEIMSLYFPIYAISQIPAGYLLDRFGVKFALSIACLVVSTGLYCMSIPHAAPLIIGRILIAMGSAFAFLGALKTASAALPERLFPVIVGLTNTIGVLGGILGQPFLNFLILKFNWEHATHYIVIFGVILAAFILCFLNTPKHKKSLGIDKQYFALFKDAQVWFLALYAGIMVGTVVNAFSELYDVTFLENTLRITSQKAATISSMIFIGIAIGGPLHGVIAKYFKAPRTSWMLITCFATILSFSAIILIAWLQPSLTYMYVFYFLSGFFVSSMLLSFSVARAAYHANMHASVFALVNMVIGICGFIFQFLLSKLLADTISYSAAFLVLLIPLIGSLFLCLQIKIKK